MIRPIRKWLLLVEVLLALSLITFAAADPEMVDSGTLEDGTEWTLDSEGVLTLDGEHIDSYSLDYETRRSVRKIALGPEVQSINAGGFGECRQVDEFIVDPANPNYASYQNALFSKDLTTLILYPSALSGSYTVPESVTGISRAAFEYTQLSEISIPGNVSVLPEYFVSLSESLTVLHVPSTLTRITYSAFRGVGSLTDIYFAGSMADWQNVEIQNSDNEGVCFAAIHCSDGDIPPQAAITGFLGENITWSLASDGTLTVSGAGEWNSWAFESNRLIKRVVLESGVTEIGYAAFYWTANVSEVIIPDTVTKIGYEAVYACKPMTSVTIPASVTEIGNEAFNGCDNLQTVYFGGTMDAWTAMVSKANEHNQLSDCTIVCSDGTISPSAGPGGPDGPDGISDSGMAGDLVWMLRNNVLTLSGTGSMPSFEQGALPWNEYLLDIREIVVEDGVTGLCDFAFDGCQYVYAISLPDTLTQIGNAAFQSCREVTEITIPDGVTCLGYSVFQNCQALQTVTIPANVVEIRDYAFYNCANLADVYYGGTREQWAEVAIESSGNEYLTGAVIHCTDGNISEPLSGSCDGFDWTMNGNDLFVDGEYLATYNLPGRVQRQAHTLYIGADITQIRYNTGDLPVLEAFGVDAENEYYCAVDGVLFSKDMKVLVAFPITRTGSYIVPVGVETLGFDAFMRSELTALTLQEGLQRLETQAIFNCRNLTEITLPASVTYIEGGAANFRYCTSLENIFVAAGNTVYEDRNGILYQKESDRLFAYPAGRQATQITVAGTLIGAAFADNRNISSVTIAEGVTGIESSAFTSSTVSSVSIPVSVQYIDADAFAGTFLSDVHYAGTVAQWAAVRIGANNENLTANVQCSDGRSSSHDFTGNLGDGISYIVQENKVTVSGAGTWNVSYAFSDNSSITSAVLEPGVTEIGWGTFSRCWNLQALQIPVSLTSIQGYALNLCDGLKDIYYAGTQEQWAAVRVDEYGNDILNSVKVHYLSEGIPETPVLSASVNASSYDYGYAVVLTASVTWPDGTTDGLDTLYPDAVLTAKLLTADGEPVPGFITQSVSGLAMQVNFPLADDSMAAGDYKIRVETSVEDLSAETETFRYTADKSGMIDPSECSLELTLNAAALGTENQIAMTATVTDQDGNPAPGVKVLFEVYLPDYTYADFFGEYTGLWNITKESGACSIRTTQSESLPAGKYIVRATIVDTEISEECSFVYYWNSLVLPASLRTIEEEAFENLAAEAVFIPEDCESIGPHAFRNCDNLLYVRIPSASTTVDATAFDGCSPELVIDRGE